MDPIFEMLDWVQDRSMAFAREIWNHKYMVLARQIVIVLILAVLLMNILLAASVVIYSIFYYLYVPIAVHTWPLHFAYGQLHPSASGSGALEYRAHLPHTFVPLGMDDRVFATNQGYDFFVELELPDSPANRDGGMFMVFLSLSGDRNSVRMHALPQQITTQAVEKTAFQDGSGSIVSIARPASIRYKSWVVNLIQNVIFAGPLMFGLMDDSHKLTVPLFSDIQDDRENPYKWASVTLSNPKMEIYSANLKAYANMKGLTYVLKKGGKGMGGDWGV